MLLKIQFPNTIWEILWFSLQLAKNPEKVYPKCLKSQMGLYKKTQ